MEKFSVIARLKSFLYAIQGLVTFVKEEHNGRIHLVAAAFALIAGWLLHISSTEWAIVVMSITMVISAELINSALERLSDHASGKEHELLRKAKDMAAGAVLVTAIAAVLVGAVIFLPKIADLLLS